MRFRLLVAACLVAVSATCLFAQSDSLRQRVASAPVQGGPGADERIAELERQVRELKDELAYSGMPPLPGRVVLCDKMIPLSSEDAREGFERELCNFLHDRGLLTVLVKRYGKFSPVISEEIERMRLPQDLIYLAIVESYLNPRAVSKADARGMWQFIRETGVREGLTINDNVDERYSVKRSTRSALGHLARLHAKFGDWLVAMAAYNAGEGRLRQVLQNQNTRDFFDMYLPEETERYIYRIAALKEILSNPDKYGLSVAKGDCYRPYGVVEMIVSLRDETHTARLARAMDLPYRSFRLYNLHIQRYWLPRGTYYLYVPIEKRDAFLRWTRSTPGVTVEREG
jgi:hypothetical protein